MEDYKKEKKLNFIVLLSLFTFPIFNYFITGKKLKYIYEIIVMAIIIILFFFRKEEKATCKKKYRNLAHLLYLLFAFIILLKCFLTLRMKYITGNYSLFLESRVLEKHVLYLIAAVYEECVFKGIVYDGLKKYNIKIFAFLFTVLMFFILHGSFTIYSIIGISLFQIYTLIIYEIEPDILKLSLFHYLSNMAILI